MTKLIIDLDTGESYTLEIAEDEKVFMNQLLQMLNYDSFIAFDGLIDDTLGIAIFNTNHIVGIHQIRSE